jgi:type VI secretion system VgrG family protein
MAMQELEGRAFLSPLAALMSEVSSTTRLYRLEGEGPLAALHVEAFTLHEALHEPWRMVLSALADTPALDTAAMRWQRVTLVTTLADGSQQRRTGLVEQATATDCIGSHGGLARYRLSVVPWLALLRLDTRSQVWQEKTLVEIVDSVLARYAALGRWRWSPCALAHLGQAPQGGRLSYCMQYRQTQLDFVNRLLAEAGLCYRFEDGAAGEPATLVILADTTLAESCPEDPASASAAGGAGIRFHRDAPMEEQDTVQQFDASWRWSAGSLGACSSDYKTAQALSVQVPTLGAVGGPNAPLVEAWAHAGDYAWPSAEAGQRALTLVQQAIEARRHSWAGRGGVRSFRAGEQFVLGGTPMDGLGELAGLGELGAAPASLAAPERRYLLTRVTHAGINNLPGDLAQALGEGSSRPGVALLAELPGVDAALASQAAERGYANRFEAIAAATPWRPLLPGADATRLAPRPRIPGPLAATVVGPDGRTEPQGADELHMDRLGRVRVRFEFQGHPDNDPLASLSSTWVRVLQPVAGAGLQAQWIPRIGHEVAVGFIGDDAERPVVLCSLYNGRGEGGTPATPGGRASNDTATPGGEAPSDPMAQAGDSVFATSTDHRPGAQGNLTGGASPAWHGGAPQPLEAGGQANAAALSGIKTQEFGGTGFNQTVFDDTDAQLRVQLATTQHASQLNLGHLVHQADNHRGSLRGVGAELRTDAYGALRGARGVLLSSYAGTAPEPALDQAASIALARQYQQLSQTFCQAALTHQAVRLASHAGSTGASASLAHSEQAPAQAWLTNVSGMLAAEPAQALADAAQRTTTASPGKLPHPTDPTLSVAARGGLLASAAQDVALTADDTVSLASGGHTDLAAGGAVRIHTGQAIGILGGAIGPTSGAGAAQGTGLTMIAGSGDLSLQAQAGTMQLAAQQDLTVQSASAPVQLQAAKRIVIANSHGSNITIADGKIVVTCPGTYTVKAGMKSLVGPQQVSTQLPLLPKGEFELIGRYAFSL